MTCVVTSRDSVLKGAPFCAHTSMPSLPSIVFIYIEYGRAEHGRAALVVSISPFARASAGSTLCMAM